MKFEILSCVEEEVPAELAELPHYHGLLKIPDTYVNVPTLFNSSLVNKPADPN